MRKARWMQVHTALPNMFTRSRSAATTRSSTPLCVRSSMMPIQWRMASPAPGRLIARWCMPRVLARKMGHAHQPQSKGRAREPSPPPPPLPPSPSHQDRSATLRELSSRQKKRPAYRAFWAFRRTPEKTKKKTQMFTSRKNSHIKMGVGLPFFLRCQHRRVSVSQRTEAGQRPAEKQRKRAASTA